MKVLPILRVFLGLTVLTGGIYPLFITAVAGAVFPEESVGSLIIQDGQIVGSKLIGQEFSSQGFFWGRPSSTTPLPYNSAAGTGSNLAPSNPALLKRVADDVSHIIETHNGKTPVPVDLVTASGSGLDPHISIAAANYQIERVAHVRGLQVSQVRELVIKATEAPTFGLLGEGRVNVLLLNLDLIKASKS